MGSNVLVFAETSNAIHGDRSKPLSQRPVMKDGDWAEYGRRVTASRRADAAGRRARRLSSPHGHDRRIRAGHRRLHERDGRGRASAARYRPRHLGRRRSRSARAPLSRRISHVHTKDVRKAVMEKSKAEDWSFLDSVIEGVYTVPGDGMVDFVSVFRELPGYSGWVVIEAEQDPKKAHPLTYAKMGYANLTRFLQGSRPAIRNERCRSSSSNRARRMRTGASIPSRRLPPAGPMWASTSTGSKRARTLRQETGDREACIVMLSGKARVAAAGQDFGVIGGRASPFEPDPWSLYVPARSEWSLTAETDCEIAVCTSPGRRQAAGARDPSRSGRPGNPRQGHQYAPCAQHPARDRSRRKACSWSR